MHVKKQDFSSNPNHLAYKASVSRIFKRQTNTSNPAIRCSVHCLVTVYHHGPCIWICIDISLQLVWPNINTSQHTNNTCQQTCAPGHDLCNQKLYQQLDHSCIKCFLCFSHIGDSVFLNLKRQNHISKWFTRQRFQTIFSYNYASRKYNTTTENTQLYWLFEIIAKGSTFEMWCYTKLTKLKKSIIRCLPYSLKINIMSLTIILTITAQMLCCDLTRAKTDGQLKVQLH